MWGLAIAIAIACALIWRFVLFLVWLQIKWCERVGDENGATGTRRFYDSVDDLRVPGAMTLMVSAAFLAWVFLGQRWDPQEVIKATAAKYTYDALNDCYHMADGSYDSTAEATCKQHEKVRLLKEKWGMYSSKK
jgi:hypothetical protein